MSRKGVCTDQTTQVLCRTCMDVGVACQAKSDRWRPKPVIHDITAEYPKMDSGEGVPTACSSLNTAEFEISQPSISSFFSP